MPRGSDRRRTVRLRAGEGSVLIEPGAPKGPGLPLVDISEGGLCFLVPGSIDFAGGLPQPGEKLDVTVELPRLEKPLVFHGLVRRMSTHGGFGGKIIGVEFVGLDEWQKAKLRGAVIEVARERIEEGYHVLRETPSAGSGDLKDLLGDLLVERDVVDRKVLEAIIASGGAEPMGRRLVRAGAVTEWQLVQALASQAGLEAVDLKESRVAEQSARLFTPAFLMSNRMVPLEAEPPGLRLAAAAAPPGEALAELRRRLGSEPEIVIGSESQIGRLLHSIFGGSGRTRRSPRIAAEIPVVFGISIEGAGDEVYEGITQNVSEGGFLFAGASPKGVDRQRLLDAERSLRVRALLGSPEDVVDAVCSPVRITEMPAPPDHWLYAARIDEISGEHRDRLRLFQFYQSFGSDERTSGAEQQGSGR